MVASRITPTMKMNSRPTLKLRSRNSPGSMNGWSQVKMCATNRYNARPASTASPTTSGLENQSSDSPRSNIICNAPIARLSMAKPNRSKRRVRSSGVSRTKAARPNQASRPNGRLM
ncbi:hypothetical protein D3C75_849900 [compost metagenome]